MKIITRNEATMASGGKCECTCYDHIEGFRIVGIKKNYDECDTYCFGEGYYHSECEDLTNQVIEGYNTAE